MTSPLLPMATTAEQPADLHPDIEGVLVSEGQIADKIAELAKQIEGDYAGREVLLVGVLKGAVMVMADLARALTLPVSMEFMAVSSYGSSTSSSGVVRILKDLDRDIAGRGVRSMRRLSPRAGGTGPVAARIHEPSSNVPRPHHLARRGRGARACAAHDYDGERRLQERLAVHDRAGDLRRQGRDGDAEGQR